MTTATATPLDRSSHSAVPGVEIFGPALPESERILTAPAVAFLASLVRRFAARREALHARRREVQERLDAGELPDFSAESADLRKASWTVAPTPTDLLDRRVEITGPTDRKMIINALNSGSSVFMADFEDSNSPTWENLVRGQANLIDAVRGTIAYVAPETGRRYRLGPRVATLMVRPRGWHLPEKHVRVDGRAIPGALFDFALFFFHNARRLVDA